MKFVKTFVVLCCIVGAGCAQNGNKNAWNYDGTKDVTLADTQEYLPVRNRDEFGAVIPYQPTLNPYEELKGRINKDSIETYINARRAFSAKKYELAEKILGELVVAEPKLSGPWVMRGDVAMAEGKEDLAIEHYAQAIVVNKLNFNAYLRLAKAQREQGHFAHAQNTYAKALAQWRDCPEAHLNLGVLYDLYLNKPMQAQAHMEAYELLSSSPQGVVKTWLSELRERTGVATLLQINEPEGGVLPASQEQSAEVNAASGEVLAAKASASEG